MIQVIQNVTLSTKVSRRNGRAGNVAWQKQTYVYQKQTYVHSNIAPIPSNRTIDSIQ